jgi:hypothetical protein
MNDILYFSLIFIILKHMCQANTYSRPPRVYNPRVYNFCLQTPRVYNRQFIQLLEFPEKKIVISVAASPLNKG